MCGTAKYLKEQNPDIVTVGIDTYGSVFKKYKETGIFDENEIYPYLTEGFGEDILPQNVAFDLIDLFIKVTDKDAAIMARRLSREEGLFVGWSCGSAVFGALEYARQNLKEEDVMVIILPDHGTRYLAKVYNDIWMKDHGFLESHQFATARDIIKNRQQRKKDQLISVDKGCKVGEAIKTFVSNGVSQLPVTDGEHIVGSLNDSVILAELIENPEIKDRQVAEIMGKPFKFVAMDNTLDVLSSLIDKDNKALLVRDEFNQIHIITQADLLLAMAG
jgi:cystathionine beta-synthase